MAIEFKTPEEIADQYLTHLKSLKPSVDIARTDSDWWIRSRVVGGLMSGLYADQRKISEDAFPQSARRDALERHLDLYFGEGFIQPTKAVGTVFVSGSNGSVMPIGTQFQYDPNGNTYQTTIALTLSGTTGTVSVESIDSGQAQNLLEGTALSIPAPPAGYAPSGEVYGAAISDGRDLETNEEAATRILDRIRNPISGGTATDYKQWAKEADSSVIDANVIRYIYGLGTVGVVITAGTTDIDAAVDAGDPVVRVPSDALIEAVQEYIDAKKPLTDCAHVIGPTEITQNVTVLVRFKDGNGSTVPAGQTLTQAELVQREVKRAIYKTPPGGRQFGATGFVVCSEIEEVIDAALSAAPYTEGSTVQILIDREVEDLSATGVNRMILANEIANPGTITITAM